MWHAALSISRHVEVAPEDGVIEGEGFSGRTAKIDIGVETYGHSCLLSLADIAKLALPCDGK
jgi:hypothetical protein